MLVPPFKDSFWTMLGIGTQVTLKLGAKIRRLGGSKDIQLSKNIALVVASQQAVSGTEQ